MPHLLSSQHTLPAVNHPRCISLSSLSRIPIQAFAMKDGVVHGEYPASEHV
ncbi:hypothetical protein D083_0016 [Dickeya solani RNS 08.23.3.1.A]|nr:hypothetical protein D083_0016 [Dickeya solani RNS 08.23.3.1.A]